MNNPDGLEQRTAFYDEFFADDDDDSEIENTPLAEQLEATLLLLHEARARLRDIATGAEMMLQPACNVQGAMRGYIQEVKRVASAPL